MALSITSIGNYLFKKSQGKSSTNDGRQFFEEPIDGRPTVFPSQVWNQADMIPATAPSLADQATSGVVKRWVQLQLAAVPGVANAFSATNLKDAIPFNFASDGSYNFQLFDSGGGAIPFGAGDWIVDPSAGTVTFYGSTPGNMPPKISFFQYVGTKGVGSGGTPTPTNPASTTYTDQSSDPATPASGFTTVYSKGGVVYRIASDGTARALATLTGTETLTNKTLNAPAITAPTGLVKGDVGLGLVDNTSDATKNTATATLTNKTLTAPVINSPTGLVKGDVGLSQVDNTSDATKNTATATLTNKTLTSPVINNPTVTGLTVDTELFSDQNATPPAPAVTRTLLLYSFAKNLMSIDPFGVIKQFASLAGVETFTNKTLTSPVITAPTGIVKGDVGLGNVDNTSDATKNAATATLTNKTLTSPVINTPTGLVKNDVGLGQVDNTSDATKNAATATLTNKTLTSPVINSPTGLVKGDVGLGQVDNTSDATKNAATATLTNKTLTAPVINAPTGLVKGDVGLGNVDNTSDATKNTATATLTNKTLTSPIVDVVVHTDITTPAAPAAGATKIYTKNGQVYRLTPDAVETLIGNTTLTPPNGGTTGKNYLAALYDGTSIAPVTQYAQNYTMNFASTTVDTTADAIAYTSCPYATGQYVLYNAGTTAIGGLTTGTYYYVVRIAGQANSFSLAATLDLAQAKRFIDLTSQGAGTHQFQSQGTGVSSGLGPAAQGITQSVNTTNPLRLPSNQRFSKATGSYFGQDWSIPFVLDRADVDISRPMKLAFKYRGSANVTAVNGSEDVKVQLYDLDNQLVVLLDGAYMQPLPAVFTTTGFQFGFTPNAGGYNMRLIISNQNTNSNPYDLDFIDFEITATTGVPGAFVTPFQIVSTNNIGAVTTAPTRGTTATDWLGYARVGDSARIIGQFRQTAAGSNGSGDYLFSLPFGLQFDLSKVATYQTNQGTGSDLGAVGLGSAGYGNTNTTVTGYVIPWDATRFRLYGNQAISGGTGAFIGFYGSAYFGFAQSNQVFKYDFMAPILGWGASATYSTNEILLKQSPTSAISSVKTGTLTAAYMAVTGNALVLQPGMYDLGGTVDFNNSGTSPAYTGVTMGWFAANGADSTAVPAALSTIPGLTILGAAPTIVQPGSGAIFTVQAPELTVRLTQPATIYLVPMATATTIANARVTVYPLANKRPDYSAFGVYGAQVQATYGLTTAAAVAAAGIHKYDTRVVDTHSAYNIATGVWTCPSGQQGTYRLSVIYTPGAASTCYAQVNGVGVGILANTTSGVAEGGTITVRVPALGTVAFLSNAAQTLAATSGTTGFVNQFTIERTGSL